MGKLSSLRPKVNKIDPRKCSAVAVERIRGGRLSRTRERIGLRDEYTCRRCGRVTAQGEVDHITPLHMGGAESDENRQWLCTGCHKRKSEQEERERA